MTESGTLQSKARLETLTIRQDEMVASLVVFGGDEHDHRPAAFRHSPSVSVPLPAVTPKIGSARYQ